MRRAFAGLRTKPGYVLTDGFPVRGLGAPALAVWKGDRVTASVAAASVIAKVSRDRMMRDLHERYPQYGFERHKGYVTDEHVRALAEHGPCPVHRYSFVNVVRAASLPGGAGPMATAEDPMAADLVAADLVDPPMVAAAAGSAAAAAVAAALVASGLSPAGAPGQNERRMDS
jgi:ribonuclease HII